MNKILRIATRKSPLALWQAHHIGQALEKHWSHISYTLVPMQTSGDTFLRDKLQTVGGKGLFVKELEEALLQNKADLAVHSTRFSAVVVCRAGPCLVDSFLRNRSACLQAIASGPQQ